MYDINEFKERFIIFENWANSKYGEDGVKIMETVHPDRKVRKDVTYFRLVRNLLTHNPNGEDKPLIVLTDEFKVKFEALCDKLMCSAIQIAIPYKDIYKREMGDKVLQTIAYMKDNSYSYVPIMNGKKVWGVFSESALFNIVGDGKMELINEDVQLFKIGSYLTEYSNTGVFDFVGVDSSIDDVLSRFVEATDNNRRLDVLYITTTGDRRGDLVGLVTVWDLTSL